MKFGRVLRRNGLSKHEIYQQGCSEGVNRKRLARYLCNYPDPEEDKEFRAHAYFLSILYSFIKIIIPSIFFAIISDDLSLIDWLKVFAIFLVIYGPAAYLTWIRNVWGLYLMLIFIGLELIKSVFEFDLSENLIGFLMLALIFVYGLYIKWNLYPYQDINHTTKKKDGTMVFSDRKP